MLGDMSENETYDVVVIGGGAAGLSGAMALGRSRRSVLVVDAGEPRNAPAGHAHNYLGREGVPPLRAARDRPRRGGGVRRRGARPAAWSGCPATADSFLVTTEGGRRYGARRVLVTGGVVDELPDVPGLAERWGVDVLHCPYCHGWEVRDQPIGDPGDHADGRPPGAAVPPAVRRRRHGRPRRRRAARRGGREARRDRRAHRARHAAGGRGRRTTRWSASGWPTARCWSGRRSSWRRSLTSRADFLGPLGIEPEPFEMAGAVLGSVIAVEPTGATAVPGVFAAGNATDISMTLMASAAARQPGRRLDQRRARGRRRGAGRRGATAPSCFEQPAWEERYSGDRGLERPGQPAARGRGRRPRARARAGRRLRRGR